MVKKIKELICIRNQAHNLTQNGFIARTRVESEPVGRMLTRIHRSNIDQWWERNCDAFIWKEAELRGKSMKDTREAVFYSERSSDQYKIFWVNFLGELFHWIDRLEEAP